ncbi:MAG: cyclase family protein [Candidatus Glassbacteria bacterium]|nr:cyclase family protein [Candidatus Glassbacteria bacterium]
MREFGKLHDISVTLGSQTAVYPDDSPFTSEKTMSLEKGEIADVSKISLSSHSGTHLDLPAHFIQGAETAESWPPEKFVLPVQVIDIDDPLTVTRQELESKAIREGAALLFRTANSLSGLVRAPVFSEDYVCLSLEAAEYCIAKKAPLIGLDYFSIDRYGDFSYPVHRRIAQNNILILENIDLKETPAGEYLLFCFPLKIAGSEASPVRAVLAE